MIYVLLYVVAGMLYVFIDAAFNWQFTKELLNEDIADARRRGMSAASWALAMTFAFIIASFGWPYLVFADLHGGRRK